MARIRLGLGWLPRGTGARALAAATIVVLLAVGSAATWVTLGPTDSSARSAVQIVVQLPPPGAQSAKAPPGSDDHKQSSAPDSHAPTADNHAPPADGHAPAGDGHQASDSHAPAPTAAPDSHAPAAPDSHAADNHAADNHGATDGHGPAPTTADAAHAAPAIPAGGLIPAPDLALIEKSTDGPLPVVGRDGRRSAQVYARPFDRSDKHPKIAIVISGLGLSRLSSDEAIKTLPPAVTLSFLPYAGNAATWFEQARKMGHEVLLDMPMEPLDYPRQDPGPRALLTSLNPRQNSDRLHWMMSRGTGYVGMISFMGSRFAADPDQMRSTLGELKERGLAFVDLRTTGDGNAMKIAGELRLPRAQVDRIIDAEVSRAGIEQRLAEVEDLARRGGSAIGVGSPYPITIQVVAAWAGAVAGRGFVLVPLSAVLSQ